MQTLNDLRFATEQSQYNTDCQQIIFEHELAYLGTLSFRCLSSLYQILIKSIHSISLPAESYADLSQLTNELIRTVCQLQASFPTRTSPMLSD